MLQALIFALIMGSRDVQGFQNRIGSVPLSLHRCNFFQRCQHQSCALKHITMATEFEKVMIPLGLGGQVLRTISGGISRALGHCMKASIEQKLQMVIYPLTTIILYITFSSTIATVQSKKSFKPLSEFVGTMFRKSGNKISALPASFSKAKIQDKLVSETLLLKASRMAEENEQRRLDAEASINQAKKDIRAKMLDMIEAELAEKSLEVRDFGAIMTVDQGPAAAAEVISAVKSIPALVEMDAVVKAASIVSEEVAAIFSPKVNEIIIAASEIQAVAVAMSIPAIAVTSEEVGAVAPFSTIVTMKREVNAADIAVAAIFALALGSPILQALHQSF